jgi:hypothetical protein
MAAVMWVPSANAPDGFSIRYPEIGDRGEIVLAEVTFREL